MEYVAGFRQAGVGVIATARQWRTLKGPRPSRLDQVALVANNELRLKKPTAASWNSPSHYPPPLTQLSAAASRHMISISRNPTRAVKIGTVAIGGGNPIAVQSMTATATQDVAATVGQVRDLEQAGADVVRIAVDSRKDAEALAEIRKQTAANLAVDLQENYRLVTDV